MAEQKVESDQSNGIGMVAEHAMENGGFVVPEGVSRANIKGLFSSQTVEKVGTGTTLRRSISKTYWYVEQTDAETVEVQPLNKNNIPSGPRVPHTMEDFLAKFNPEPEYYQAEVFPKMRELGETLQRAEEQRQKGALYSAQFEFQQALTVDDESVRANFGLGLTYMERGDTKKANDIFERLVNMDAAFSMEHKHLFNEFGINLRKSKLHDQAVEYYTKALDMSDVDENLHYNIARAYFEKGDRPNTLKHLKQAHVINPDHEEIKKFLEFVETKTSA